MPEISRFFGIVITMYYNYNNHGLPHFHAKYGGHKAKILVENGVIIDGTLPRRAALLVEEWRIAHLGELHVVWGQIIDRKPHVKIEPLE